jgi:hypothetical protein
LEEQMMMKGIREIRLGAEYEKEKITQEMQREREER